ncbi:MAG: DUF4230 domain-containing protein [Lawsonibacter sp.]|jgi:hypothetical protein|nr:DUF4230 domain-containing protein [Lawsonibacter sp.]
MKNTQLYWNAAAGTLAALVLAVIIWGCAHGAGPLRVEVSDGIEPVDLDTVYLSPSGVEVNFSDVILSRQNETRKLIVRTQNGTVSTKLTDRLINQLDFDFMKKTQNVSYTGTGCFVVDLDRLTAANVVEDKEKKTVTIRIGHAYLESIDINPNNIIIDDVKEGLLAWGDIKLTVADYNTIERELRARLEEEFDTAANGQAADEAALRMVKEVYEPVVKAIDRRYSVVVQFQ